MKFWETKDPTKKDKKLSPRDRAWAKARAQKSRRPYPNMVDNVAASKRN
jgi:hypothetical protein